MNYPLLNDVDYKKVKEEDLKLELSFKSIYKDSFSFLKNIKNSKIVLKYILILSAILYVAFLFFDIKYNWIASILFMVLYPILAFELHPKQNLEWKISNFFYMLKPKHLFSVIAIIFFIFLFFWLVVFMILPLLELHANRFFFYFLVFPALFVIFFINSIFLVPFISSLKENIKITFNILKSSFFALSKMWIVLISFNIILQIYIFFSNIFLSEYYFIFLLFYLLIQIPITIASIFVVLQSYKKIVFS